MLIEKFDSANYEISADFENPDAIILRSFKMHDMELPASLKAVARGTCIAKEDTETYKFLMR